MHYAHGTIDGTGDVNVEVSVSAEAPTEFTSTNQANSGNANGGSSFMHATWNSIILLIGLGTLSSPYAIAKSGYMGILTSIFVAAFYWYATILMCRCMDREKSIGNYQQIASKAFPRWGRVLTTALFYVETVGTLVGFFISIGDMITFIVPNIDAVGFLNLKGRDVIMGIALIIILPTTWIRQLSVISVFSFCCATSVFVIIICVLCLGATTNGIGFGQELPVLRLKGIPEAIGIYSFAYGATPVFPSLYKSMRKPAMFPKVLWISFTIAIGSYLLLGVTGALMFGVGTKSLVTLNLPKHLLGSKVANWVSILIPMTKFTLLIFPLVSDLEEMMIEYFSLKMGQWKTLVACILLRSGVAFSILLVAISLPYFSSIIELVGSSMTITLCFILPCIFYLKIFHPSLKKLEVIGILCMVFISVVAGMMGTVIAFKNLIIKTAKN